MSSRAGEFHARFCGLAVAVATAIPQKQSFAIYSSFIGPAFSDDRRILGRLRVEASAAVADQIKDVRSPAEAERQGQATFVAKIREFVIRDQRGDAVRRTVGFFDQASICADIEICDRVSLYRLLHDEAYQTG
ncbi:hypothetical protein BJF95_13430 [Rhizobium oryziradicis]|uniref:Uncharacterized protein n=1 Tax=Rhizobium oryziradicis TaxID=1867956 RepID=A0A1Q8ZKL3_9HYPH|nr:hypothetical protein BJF95_13430 [Rhizobium oryziradicis]